MQRKILTDAGFNDFKEPIIRHRRFYCLISRMIVNEIFYNRTLSSKNKTS